MLFGMPIPLLVMLFLGIVITIIGIACRIIECVCCTEEIEAVCVQIESTKNAKTTKQYYCIVLYGSFTTKAIITELKAKMPTMF